MAREKRGAEKGRNAGRERPPEPGGAVRRIEHVVLCLEPIGVAVDVEGHPEAVIAVHARGKNGVGAERSLYELVNQTVVAFARNPEDLVCGVARRDEHTFAGSERLEEIHAVEGIGGDECVLGEIDRRNDVLGYPLRIRELGEHAKTLQPPDHGEEEESAEEEKRPPEEARAARFEL